MARHNDRHHQLRLPFPTTREPCVAEAPAGTPAPPRTRKLASELTDAELLTKLLGPSTSPVCRTLTATYENLRTIATLPSAELVEHGFTGGAVERLHAVFEIARRYGETEWPEGQAFCGSADVYGHFRERLATEACEHFYAVLLDQKHRKIRDVVVSKGSLTASVVHPRDIYAQVIRHAAAAVIFVHNHPSGDPTPSAEDIALTRWLREVADLVGVRVLDHIIVGKGRYVSFDDGYW